MRIRRLTASLHALLRQERGAVAVVVCIAMTVLLGFSALVVDMGAMYLEKSNLQNALDAAALAGARELPNYSDALYTAEDYFERNGYDKDDLTVEFADARTITCKSTEEMQTSFARVLGVDKMTTTELHATALHTERVVRSPFDYGIFQGSPGKLLDMGGGAFTVDGGVFSNGAFRCKPGGGGTYITGLETVSGETPDILSNVYVGEVITDAEPIEMVDMKYYFDDLLDEACYGRSFTTATASQINTWQNTWNGPVYINGNVTVNGDFSPSRVAIVSGILHVTGNLNAGAGIQIKSGGTLIVDGNLSISGWGENIPIFTDCLVYVGGSISANPGVITYFYGYNNVYSNGSMVYGGSGIYTEYGDYAAANTFFYSHSGDISLTASSNCIYITGIVYSYQGTVYLKSRDNICGAAIGKHIDSTPAGLIIEYPDGGVGHCITEDAYLLID